MLVLLAGKSHLRSPCGGLRFDPLITQRSVLTCASPWLRETLHNSYCAVRRMTNHLLTINHFIIDAYYVLSLTKLNHS